METKCYSLRSAFYHGALYTNKMFMAHWAESILPQDRSEIAECEVIGYFSLTTSLTP